MKKILKAKLVVILMVLTSVEVVYSECCCNSCRKVKNNNGGGRKSSGSKKNSTPKRIPGTGSLGNCLGNRGLNKKDNKVSVNNDSSNTKKNDHIKEIINDKNSGSKLPAKNPTAKQSEDMYPSDFKLDELNSDSKGKASPEHGENKTITEYEKKKYVVVELGKYMNTFVTPGFNWGNSFFFNDFGIESPNGMIKIGFVGNINELYDKIKKASCEHTDSIKDIEIELLSFDVECDQDGTPVKNGYDFKDFPKTIGNLKDCLNKGMSNEIIYKNWYFLPVNGYFGNNYYNFYICLNNGKIYSIVWSKSSKLHYLSPVSIYKSPDTKGFVTNVAKTGVYRNGKFYDISGSVDFESPAQSHEDNFEKININWAAFSTINKLKYR